MVFENRNSGDSLFSIKASEINGWNAAAKDYLQNQQNQTTNSAKAKVQNGIVLVKNNSGSDVARFGILSISDVLVTPTTDLDLFKFNYALIGVAPSDTYRGKAFCITQEPIKAGELGKALVNGITPVQIDATYEDLPWADIIVGDTTKLLCGASGAAKIIYRQGTSGIVWALVALGNGYLPPVSFGKLAADSTGGKTISLQPCTASGTVVSNLPNVTVYLAPNRAETTVDYKAGDIISFKRFLVPVSDGGNVDGVVIGTGGGGGTSNLIQPDTHIDTDEEERIGPNCMIYRKGSKWVPLDAPSGAYLVLTCMEDCVPIWGPVRAL